MLNDVNFNPLVSSLAFLQGVAQGLTVNNLPVGTRLPQNDPLWAALHENDISLLDGQTIYRLREGIERFMVTDINNPSSSTLAQSELVVMWDISVWPTDPVAGTPSFNHPPGGNILYMDGHVEFVRYRANSPSARPGWR